METVTDDGSGRSGSVRATMSIFGESIGGRKPDKNRRHVQVQENLSSEIRELAKSGMDKLNDCKASVEKERARAESELSRARTMAKELERQIEQTKAKARSQRSELQAMWATRRRKKGMEASDTQEECNTQYTELTQELDRVKKELHKLRLEVKTASEAKAKAEIDMVASTSKIMSNVRTADEMKPRIDEANEEHVLVELARIEAERERREIEAQRGVQAEQFAKDMEAMRKKIMALEKDLSRAKELDAKLAMTNSDVEVLQAEMELVRAMERNHVKNDSPEVIAKKQEEAQDKALMQAAEAELIAAKTALETIKEEGFQFMTSMDRTRTEIMQVTEEARWLKEKEKKTDAQVQQLNTKLLKAKSRMEAVAAAEERGKAIVSNLTVALQQLRAEMEAAGKEKELAELESRCVQAETNNISVEIAATEEKIRQSVKELEAAKALEAAAMKKLKAVAESTMQAREASPMSRKSGTITISRFEYEYLSGRAVLVRVIADKKVAAAQAWVQALKTSENEIAMRAKAAERETREMGAKETEADSEADMSVDEQKAMEQELCDLKNDEAERDDLQCAYAPRRRSVRESRVSGTSRRTRSRRSSGVGVARNPRSPSFTIKRKRRVMPNFLKLIKERRGKNAN